MTTPPAPAPVLIPGSLSPRFVRFFGWYVRSRLMPSRFAAVRAAGGSGEVLSELDSVPEPVIVLLSHSSWWDPLVAMFLGRRFMASRGACAPMDAEQLKRFGFFKRLGLFGIDPDDPASLKAMMGYVLERFARETRPTLYITPQGRFADVRAPIELRPGAAAIAAEAQRRGRVHVVSVAIEYGFWVDQKPEIFVRCAHVKQPATASTAGWHRAIQHEMEDNARALAQLVIARDESVMENLLATGARVHPVYDLWLRLTGRTAGIDMSHRSPGAVAGNGEHRA